MGLDRDGGKAPERTEGTHGALEQARRIKQPSVERSSAGGLVVAELGAGHAGVLRVRLRGEVAVHDLHGRDHVSRFARTEVRTSICPEAICPEALLDSDSPAHRGGPGAELDNFCSARDQLRPGGAHGEAREIHEHKV